MGRRPRRLGDDRTSSPPGAVLIFITAKFRVLARCRLDLRLAAVDDEQLRTIREARLLSRGGHHASPSAAAASAAAIGASSSGSGRST